ncbi:MAG: right-handed parallel beta-helix repeat-containing protein, partial [Planctomycetota bacterium]
QLNITIRAAKDGVGTDGFAPKNQSVAAVVLSGAGFDYSGVGSTPRAIIQIEPSGDGASILALTLQNVHNESGNGAGIRINGVDRVTISRCRIHRNDMGLMSNPNRNADGSFAAAKSQVIRNCHVHHNGNESHSGYNHNYYMGGHDVSVIGCEIDHATTAHHNYKSRAHQNSLLRCHFYHAANRDLDFVDAPETTAPGSNAIVVQCRITKSADATGN